jgi:hypothetical protein
VEGFDGRLGRFRAGHIDGSDAAVGAAYLFDDFDGQHQASAVEDAVQVVFGGLDVQIANFKLDHAGTFCEGGSLGQQKSHRRQARLAIIGEERD